MASESEPDSSPSSPEKHQKSDGGANNGSDSEEEEEEEEGNNQALDESELLCDVCGGDASWEDDPVLLCDGCDVGVHASCYGVKVFLYIYIFPLYIYNGTL